MARMSHGGLVTESAAALILRAQLAGFTLRPRADGSFIASRWGHVRFLADEQAARRWLAMVSGNGNGTAESPSAH